MLTSNDRNRREDETQIITLLHQPTLSDLQNADSEVHRQAVLCLDPGEDCALTTIFEDGVVGHEQAPHRLALRGVPHLTA